MTLCYCYRAAMDDAALTRFLCAGDDRAVGRLFDRFALSLYRYCLTLLPTPESAAEALCNTLLAAVDRADRLAHPRRLEVWLFALARNECLRTLRRSGHRLPSADFLDGVGMTLRLPRRRDRDEEGGLAEIQELIQGHSFHEHAVAAVLGIRPWHAKVLARRGEARGTVGGRATGSQGAAWLPEGLRARVLADAALPVRTTYRGELAGPFRRSGFPVPLDRSGRGRRRILAAAAVVAILALAAVVSSSAAPDPEVVVSVGEPIDGPLHDGQFTTAPPTSGPLTSATPTATTTPGPPTATPSAPASPGQAAPTRSTRPPPAPRPPAPPPAPRIPPAATGVITGIGGGCVEVVSGGGIELLSCDGTSSQQWTVGGDGTLHAFRSCMNVRDGGTANGTSVNLSKCNSSGAQQWLTGPNGSLINPQSGKCLDGPNNSGDPRRLEIWTCNGGAYQRWTLPG